MADTHLSIQTPTMADKTAAVVELPLSSRSLPLEGDIHAERSDGNTTNYLQGFKLHVISVTSVLLFRSCPLNWLIKFLVFVCVSSL